MPAFSTRRFPESKRLFAECVFPECVVHGLAPWVGTLALCSSWSATAIAIAIFLHGNAFAQTNNSQLERYEYSSPTMGTVLRMVVYSKDERGAQLAIDAGLDEIERLIPILNNYDPASEVSKLSQAAFRPAPLSLDLAATLVAAQRWHALSAGQFDITVGPVTRLWSRARKERRLPDPNEILEAQKQIGWENLRWLQTDPATKDLKQHPSPPQTNLTATPLQLELLSEGMIIDVSGLATGYIIDRAFEAIIATGHNCILIDIGGDIRMGSPPPESQGWTIEIAGIGKNSPPLCNRSLHTCAITTSGDLNQFIEIDGRRYSHLIDPISGNPLERRQSATVIATTAVDADAGATALCLMGLENSSQQFDGMPLIEAYLMEVSHEDQAVKPRIQTQSETVRYRHLISSTSDAR